MKRHDGQAPERAVIGVQEARAVVGRYALTRPITLQPLGLGSRHNAKSRLVTPRGDFLLKCRAPARSGAAMVEFVHTFHRHLEARAVPVAPLVLDRSGCSAVVHEGQVYELYRWVQGERWKRTSTEAGEAGVAFGRMIRAAVTCAPKGAPRIMSFHAHPVLADGLARIPRAACRADPDTDAQGLAEVCGRLAARAARAAERAAEIQELPQMVVHGDLHPGNVLFHGGRVQAILDFDGAHLDWRACEIANAALHFGNDPMSGVPVHRWDPALDMERVRALVAGVEEGMGEPLLPAERRALPWLMIEACTLESVAPILRTGRFAHLRADALLAFVDQKAAWIEANGTLE